MASHTTLGLDVTDWLGLLTGIALFMLFIGLVFVFRSQKPSNSASVIIKEAINSPVTVDQSDRSSKQTQVNTNVRVDIQSSRQSLPPERPHELPRERRSRHDSDTSQAIFFTVCVVVFLMMGVYVKYFEQFVLVTRAWYIALAAYSLLGYVALVTRFIEPADTSYHWFLVFLAGTALGGWILLDAQTMIDPAIVEWAQTLPSSSVGAITLIKQLFKYGGLLPVFASTLMFLLSVMHALVATAAVTRQFVLSFWSADELGWFARFLLSITGFAAGGRYVIKASFCLVGAALIKYGWLPYVMETIAAR